MSWNFLLEIYNFLRLQIFVRRHRLLQMLFANAPKIWYFKNYLQFIKIGTRKGMDVKWALDAIKYICLCSNLCTYLFVHLCEKKIFIKIPALIYYLTLSIFGRFGILTRRILGGWMWNVESFWRKLWENSICEWSLHKYTNIGKTEIFHV